MEKVIGTINGIKLIQLDETFNIYEETENGSTLIAVVEASNNPTVKLIGEHLTESLIKNNKINAFNDVVESAISLAKLSHLDTLFS